MPAARDAAGRPAFVASSVYDQSQASGPHQSGDLITADLPTCPAHRRMHLANPAYRPSPPTEKSSGTASVLTFFFPGAGHLYLGDNQKAMPGLIVNTIGLILAFSVILLPISRIGWAITPAMTLPYIKQDTERANAEALARYQQR